MVTKIVFKALAMFAACWLSAAGTASAKTTPRVMTLDELFNLAEAQSKSIRRAEAAGNTAEAAARAARNAQLPDINIALAGSYAGNVLLTDRDFSNAEGLKGPHWGNSLALTVRQTVFSGGAVSGSIESADLRHDMARLNVETEQQKVRYLLTGYYLDLYKTRNLLSVCDKNISRTQQVIADMRAKEEAGTVLPNDVTRYEVQLQNLLYRRTELLSQIDVLNHQLVTTLDLPTDTDILPDTTLTHLTTQRYSELELLELANEHQPTLLASQKGIELSRKEQKIVHAGLLPKVSVMAEDHFNGPITFELPPIDKNLNTWFVGVGVAYNIGNLYKTPKDLARSRRAVVEAQTRHDENYERVTLEVHQAYVHYQNAFELLSTQEKSLLLANENYAVVENRYQNDLAVIIDLLDADNLRQDAEAQLVNAQINIIHQYYRLKYVTGTL